MHLKPYKQSISPTLEAVLKYKAESQDVFESVGRRVVDSVVDGINGTIMAYGQTGSGKTFTMAGGGAFTRTVSTRVEYHFQ